MPPVLPYRLYNEDCFVCMDRLQPGSVDMVLADLPYGTTQCKWDTVLPLDRLWAAYKRVCKPNAAIVLTASQPFTSALVMSNPSLFRHEWIWEKAKATGHLDVSRKPMKAHENVLVFYAQQPTYLPQKTEGKPYKGHGGKSPKTVYGDFKAGRNGSNDGSRFPRSVIEFQHEAKPVHSTQKPVDLMEYFVKTYTNSGELVLDNCMGSGTTGVACMNLGRKFIGCDNDRDHGYFEIATKRIREAYGAKKKESVSA